MGGTVAETDQVETASRMAGDWWASRLDEKYADKRGAFAESVARRVREQLLECGECYLEVDYDAFGVLLDAIRETVDPKNSGCLFSADGILPLKTTLRVTPERMSPKEGYGNRTPEIMVPVNGGADK